MDIKVRFDNKAAREALARLVMLGHNLEPVMKIIRRRLRSITLDAFEEEKDPATGKPWAPLSPVTLAIRKKAGRGETKLQQSRRLIQSIVTDHDSDSAIVGTNLIYAPTHQFGAKKGEFGSTGRASKTVPGLYHTKQGITTKPRANPWGNIPARPFLGIGEKHRDRITAAVVKKVNTIIESGA